MDQVFLLALSSQKFIGIARGSGDASGCKNERHAVMNFRDELVGTSVLITANVRTRLKPVGLAAMS